MGFCYGGLAVLIVGLVVEVPLALLSEWERPSPVMQAGLGALFLGVALGYVLGRRELVD